MSVTIKEVIGRIGVQTDSAANQKVTKPAIKEILKFNHLDLHMRAPNVLSEYLTRKVKLSILTDQTDGFKYLDISDSILATALGVNASDLLRPEEIQSIGFLGSPNASYKHCISFEHYLSLSEFKTDEESGRWWWSNRGENKILVYQGTQVSSENALYVSYTRHLDTDYSTEGNEFDCPPKLVNFIVIKSVADALIDRKLKLPEGVQVQLDKQEAMVTQLDAAIAARTNSLNAIGADR